MKTDIAPPAGNLPAEPNSFVGRERDLEDLAVMLGRVRALTLCGPGGIGKTRLALRLAATVAPRYPDGAWLVDLAQADLGGAGDPGRLMPQVTSALGIRSEPDRPLADTLTDALRPRTTLLVLDTCERHAQDCAELAERLLAGCPGLRIIATSREPLRVRGEVIWRVPPLGLPPAGDAADVPNLAAGDAMECEAVRLFVARAAAVRPGFSLDEVNAAAVLHVCRTLDGVPLAIELAAARVRSLSAQQISDRLADRFELLAHGDRTAPPRQQTLRAAVEWSFDLLTPAERLLLGRLSVFRGWSLEMAEQVCAGAEIPASRVLELLTALIDKSLVSVDAELNGDARYRLLDTVREFAVEQAIASGELPGLRVAHRNCLLALAERIAGQAFVRGEPSWPARVAMYHRVRADRANFNLALACCAERGDAQEGLRLCYALAGSWLASGDVAEGAAWIDRLLAVDEQVPPGIRARALALRAELAFEEQDYAGAAGHARECIALSADCEDGNPACGLRMLALVALQGAHVSEALASADAAVEAARSMADDWEEGIALATRAVVVASQGKLADAQAVYHEALDVLKGNNGWGVANALYGLGRIARSRGDADGALRYFGDALAIYRQIHARPEMARCLAGIGWVALSQSDLDQARASLTESLWLSVAAGQRLAIARGLIALAMLASAAGEHARAVRLASSAGVLFEAIGGLPGTAARRIGEVIDAARARFDPASVAAMVTDGAAMGSYDAARLAAEDPEPAASPPSWPGPLTEREHEVARLVAQGLSNRDIGDRLFISQATAARHVANIFAKLGLRSRAQVATWLVGQAGPSGPAGA